MKDSIVTRASAGLVSLLILVLGFSTAMAESTYPVATRAIPNSSIIPNQKISPVPKFIGKTATAKPVTVNIPVPQHPFMAENPWNCMHNDSYQSDVYPGPGPLGSNPVVSSTWLGPPYRTVWTNESVSIPSLITKMSLDNGLIYTYTKPKGPATTDPWYFTAIDFETGETVRKILAGLGVLYNNHYAGAYLGSDGTLYVGVLGGIVAMRDGE